MNQNNEQNQESNVWPPKVIVCYRNGWRQLRKYFLELLLIIIVSLVIGFPGYSFSEVEYMEGIDVVIRTFGLAYILLIILPINYGVSFGYLRAARGDKLNVKDIFKVFPNYLNAIFANLLVFVIIGIGLALLIVPGIIFACKLAFTPYLVVSRKMEVIEAVKKSWRMTKGYSWRIFLIGLLAIPVAIAGLICLGVGIIASIMWVNLAFASFYHVVSMSEENI